MKATYMGGELGCSSDSRSALILWPELHTHPPKTVEIHPFLHGFGITATWADGKRHRFAVKDVDTDYVVDIMQSIGHPGPVQIFGLATGLYIKTSDEHAKVICPASQEITLCLSCLKAFAQRQCEEADEIVRSMARKKKVEVLE